jgi:hypothetical protein
LTLTERLRLVGGVEVEDGSIGRGSKVLAIIYMPLFFIGGH